MTNLRDVMSPELQQHLKMYRKGVLSIFQGLRSGVIDDHEAAMNLIIVDPENKFTFSEIYVR